MATTREYFNNIFDTFRTIAIGMRITLKYFFAKTVTVQYPDVPPVTQQRFRGFHWYEAEKCIACDACAKACPVDCIYIEKSGPRKKDKVTGLAVGGALERYAIDYSKCLLCGLCCEPCPTDCIHMGDNHDLSAFTREDMIVEFTELVKQGKQTPEPYWMSKPNKPAWAAAMQKRWEDRAAPVREHMLKALEVTTPTPPPPKPAAKKPEADAGDAKKAAPEKPAAAEKKPEPKSPSAEKPAAGDEKTQAAEAPKDGETN